MSTPDLTAKPKTARHFAEGDRVFHKTYGFGEIRRGRGLYPYFPETKTTGTGATRLWPVLEASS